MHIKINEFRPLAFKETLLIVKEYCKIYETRIKTEGMLGFFYRSEIKTTGKYATIIKCGYRNYHVKCSKTKTSYVFNIWLAP